MDALIRAGARAGGKHAGVGGVIHYNRELGRGVGRRFSAQNFRWPACDGAVGQREERSGDVDRRPPD